MVHIFPFDCPSLHLPSWTIWPRPHVVSSGHVVECALLSRCCEGDWSVLRLYRRFHSRRTENQQQALEMSAGNAKISHPAPQFKVTAVVDGQFKDVQLSDYRGKYVILFFYPLDFTFVCPTEIIAFSDRVDEFRKIGCEVLAASTDSHFSHLAWINTPRKQGGLGSMNIPLLADLTQSISRDYGVLKEDEGIAYRGLFVIDDKGILRQITINDLPVGRSVDETLRLVQAFQHTDKHGEVCPAGWKPGSDTIIPDVQKSKEFFSKQ
ncbi:hypothetical protein PDJAM_G00161160 [Pangasius djambal]|uniref:Uncharacterized protein n=1 Tax=Pangasius djambal TaxID=1691987 RepID=A0ACC5ZJY1_9TELE|nr:hypothetical protein [Pangasius djambal]